MREQDRKNSTQVVESEEGSSDEDANEGGLSPPPAKRSNVFRSPDKLSEEKNKRKRRRESEAAKKSRKDEKSKKRTDEAVDTTGSERTEQMDELEGGEVGRQDKASTPVAEQRSVTGIKVRQSGLKLFWFSNIHMYLNFSFRCQALLKSSVHL